MKELGTGRVKEVGVESLKELDIVFVNEVASDSHESSKTLMNART